MLGCLLWEQCEVLSPRWAHAPLTWALPGLARHPIVMIMEGYRTFKTEVVSPFEPIWDEYLRLMNNGNKETSNFIAAQHIESLQLGMNSNILLNDREQEMKVTLLGKEVFSSMTSEIVVS
ncbi:hypothetical protein B7494_g3233 [Chlorociboria aeruginascens]|nr:hypothetical protein B7494_g3233 [Chlorociboria aeruginascens]